MTRADERSVLVIDDDDGTRQTYGFALTRLGGYRVQTAASALLALDLLAADRFGMLVVDLRLPDMSGLQFVQELFARQDRTPFILVSAFVDVPTAVCAMRLGAQTVLEKPVDIDELVLVVRRIFETIAPPVSAATSHLRAATVSARLAVQILKATESPADLKTMADWARFVGVSGSSLGEMCRLVRLRPHDVRDFTRVLRSIIRSRNEQCLPELLIDVSDHRTLRVLLHKAGLGLGSSYSGTLHDYISGQHFIPVGHPVLAALTSFFELPDGLIPQQN